MKPLTAIFLLISTNAYAVELTCEEIKALVVLAGGAANAESIARSQGVSEEMIDKAKRCLEVKRPGVKPGH